MTSQLERKSSCNSILEELPDREGSRTNAKGILREIVETAGLTMVIFFLVRLAFQNLRIEMQSMEPNLHHGQFLVINKLVYYLHRPQRGDVIVFHSPENPRKDFVKRVVGLQGEEVEIREGQVLVNGTRLEETHIAQPANEFWGTEVVGESEYFVLGDNRNSSRDSGSWGMLDAEVIIGKAWICYWPPQEWGLVAHYALVSG